MNITFEKISEDNFDKVVSMKVLSSQEHFVASNLMSLAQAYLYYENHDVYPFAICNDGSPVGFAMLDEDLEEKTLNIWRIMIDAKYQGKGYGTEAIKHIIDLSKQSQKYTSLTIDYCKGNDTAKHVYESLGFRETGEECNGNEVVMKMKL